MATFSAANYKLPEINKQDYFSKYNEYYLTKKFKPLTKEFLIFKKSIENINYLSLLTTNDAEIYDFINTMKKINNNDVVSYLEKYIKHNNRSVKSCSKINNITAGFTNILRNQHQTTEHMKKLFNTIYDSINDKVFDNICYCLDINEITRNITISACSEFKHDDGKEEDCDGCIYISLINLIKSYKLKFIVSEIFKYRTIDYDFNIIFNKFASVLNTNINTVIKYNGERLKNPEVKCPEIKNFIVKDIYPLLCDFVAKYYYLVDLFKKLVYTIYGEYGYADNNKYLFIEEFRENIFKTIEAFKHVKDYCSMSCGTLGIEILNIALGGFENNKEKENFNKTMIEVNTAFQAFREFIVSGTFEENMKSIESIPNRLSALY